MNVCCDSYVSGSLFFVRIFSRFIVRLDPSISRDNPLNSILTARSRRQSLGYDKKTGVIASRSQHIGIQIFLFVECQGSSNLSSHVFHHRLIINRRDCNEMQMSFTCDIVIAFHQWNTRWLNTGCSIGTCSTCW